MHISGVHCIEWVRSYWALSSDCKKFLSNTVELHSHNDFINYWLEDRSRRALKRSDNLPLCLQSDELDLLENAKCFLKPFEDLTELVSTTRPTLSLVPLMKIRVKKFVQPIAWMMLRSRHWKHLVLNSVDNQLQETEACSAVQILNPNAIPYSSASWHKMGMMLHDTWSWSWGRHDRMMMGYWLLPQRSWCITSLHQTITIEMQKTTQSGFMAGRSTADQFLTLYFPD